MTNDSQPNTVSRRILIPAVVVAVVLAGIAVGALAMTLLGGSERAPAAADATMTASASTSQSTAAEPSPSETPGPTPEPTVKPLEADSIARVTVDDLNVRTDPSSSAKSIGHLSAGARAFVIEGPQQADGYGWYHVVALADPDGPNQCTAPVCQVSAFGWVAGSTDAADDWLVPVDLSCPDKPSFEYFTQLPAFERLACYRDQRVTLKGVVWQPCCGYVGATIYEPSWLSWPTGVAYLNGSAPPLEPGGFVLRFDPRDHFVVPNYADIVRVTGHLDDRAARTCTVKIDESAQQQDPALKVDPDELALAPIGCRTEFVVDEMEVLGNTGEKCLC